VPQLRYTPSAELLAILRPAYPCLHFADACATARWDPPNGFVPRGFVGALGSLDQVKLVLLIAEPGNGLPGETHPFDGNVERFMNELCEYVYVQFDRRASLFHQNVRYLLDQCWPGLSLRDQLTRTWITETYLCSAPVSTAPIPTRAWQTCVATYLRAQLRLLPDALVVALGGKAQERAGRLAALSAFSPAPPGCNQRGARPSWDAIGSAVRKRYPIAMTRT
jgi:uracil DNA glycosylase superfamily protein